MSTIFRAGWTERIIYALARDGDAVNLTGSTAIIVGKKASGAALGFGGTFGIVSATDGTVYFDPLTTDLTTDDAPYFIRWSVTDASGKISYFPRSGPITWEIQNP